MGCYYITTELPNRLGEGMPSPPSTRSISPTRRVSSTCTPRSSSASPSTKSSRATKTTRGSRRVDHQHHVRPHSVQPNPSRGMDFYNQPLRSSDLAKRHFRLLPGPGPQGHHRPPRRHEPAWVRESTRSGLSFATDDLVTPASKSRHISEAEKQVLRFKKLYERASSPSWSATTGARHLDPRPRANLQGDALGDGGRRSRRPRVHQPGVPHGALRRARAASSRSGSSPACAA